MESTTGKATRRRDNGDGYVSRRPNPKTGLYSGAIYDFAGKRRWVYGRSIPDVKKKLKDLAKEREVAIANGGEGSKDSLAVYLPFWLKSLKEGGAKPRTVECYQVAVDNLIAPHLGHVQLSKVTGFDGHRLLDKLKEAGKSDYTRGYAFKVLRAALGYAVHLRSIPSNPLLGIRTPKREKREPTWWTPEEANAFLAATKDDPLYPLYVVAVDTGARIGELLALQWSEVDLRAGTMTIKYTLGPVPRADARHAPKTAQSTRTVPLTSRALAALRGRLERIFGLGWAATCPWVFPSVNGSPMYQTNVTRRFVKAAKAAGVPRIRFHDIRHTHASILVRAGVDHAEAAARLGHTVPMFQNTYVHVDQDQARAVVDKFAAIMGVE